MNAKKLLTISALLIAASTIPAYSYADRGGDSAGGGNTINYQLIEDYAINPKDLGAGYELAMKKLEKLKERVPGFASRIERNIKDYSWYLIPGKIRELPFERTGLNFSSDQTAYQKGEEVFMSDALSSFELEKQSRLLMHEFLMTESDNKDVARVRKLMVYLQQNNFAPDAKELSKKIQSLGFGHQRYLTSEEIKKIDEEVLTRVRAKTKAGIEKLIEYCAAEEGNSSNWNRASGEEKIKALVKINSAYLGVKLPDNGLEVAVASEMSRVAVDYQSKVMNDTYVDFIAALNTRHKKTIPLEVELMGLSWDITWGAIMFDDGRGEKFMKRSDEFSSLSADERFSLACKNARVLRQQLETPEQKASTSDREAPAADSVESAPAN